MNSSILSTPSVGSLVKKVTEINPRLNVDQVIAIVREALSSRAGIDVVDEARAVELARATLNPEFSKGL
jgi:hypothetical protein